MRHREPDKALYQEVARAAWLGVAVNLALGCVKLIGGWISGSYALLSDAVNSLGDVVTSGMILVALHVAQRPPDAEHPYGHTRAEAIAATNVALLVILSALAIGWEALHSAPLAGVQPPIWTLWIAGANVLIKEALYRYKLRVARHTGSQAIMAVAWDHRSDAFCSLAVLVALAAVRFGGDAWLWADEAGAVVVVIAIIWSSVRLFRSSASELMDVQADKGLVEQIRQTAERVSGVENVETLWVRKSGLEYFADIHIEVDPQMTVADGHRIGHAVKDRLLEQFAMLHDVLVHLEPAARANSRPDKPR